MGKTSIELLKRSDVFAGLTDEQLERVDALAERVSVPEDAAIVEEDERGTRCYLLVTGRVEIEVRPPYGDRRPQKIATITAGQPFGELSLVDGFLRSATARALEPTELLAFENKRLEELMADDPKIGYRVMRNLASLLAARIRSTNMKLRNALSDVFYY